MAELSPWTWIVVGGLVTVVSLIMREIRFFAIVGVLFILFGMVRMLLSRRKGSGARRPMHVYHTQRAEPEANGLHAPGTKKRCFVCGAYNASAANFCGHCGHRLP